MQELARSYRNYLSGSDANVALNDICRTAGVRRSHHDCRLALTGRSKKEMVERIDKFLAGELSPGLHVGQKKPAFRPGWFLFFPDRDRNGGPWDGNCSVRSLCSGKP
ncbi:hypothetical protein [Acetonema longum]|uniref:MtaE protein n=1 Tax=Acetonema longum DSM 6540 TaxID=1009370 RepID=F7NDS6_9FIRM|nr:hypothetical protein [Acetonema longum]EGO65797.1 MtaE protein [Acetonema longum DSM 6540]